MDSASSTAAPDTQWQKRESSLIRFSNRSNLLFWLLIAGAVALALCIYWKTLYIGFLLDDFYHLNYLMRAFGGEPQAVIGLLWSNWSPDTTLTSYRPLVSFSLALDYGLWNINAFGYHLTNLLLFAGCTTLVALIGREVCTAYEVENSALVGGGAALLFAVYPLHPEAVAWIIGRVDVLCGVLTLLSAYLYFVQRRTGSRAALAASLTAFLCAMASKEMAVTLPAVLTIFEFTAIEKPNRGNRSLLWMWGALAAFAVWRTFILGTVVGGYGGTGWKTIKQGLKNFADNATLIKLFFGASEEFPVPPALHWASRLAFLAIDIAAIVFLKLKKDVWRAYIFLFGWTFLTILPTFQIWHIWPNLVGSRLFFIGSAPLCIGLSLAAIGTVNQIRWKPILGGIAVLLLTIVWSLVLNTNLSAWTGAAQRLAEVRTTLQNYFPKLSSSFKVFLPTLPQDYKGAPILGRPEYLYILCRPPFAYKDYTSFVLTTEPYIAGGMEYVGPAAFEAGKRQSEEILFYDPNDPLFERINHPIAAPSISVMPADPLSLGDRWDWLHRRTVARTILSYDCATVPGAKSARVFISRPWQPFTNAPRAVPPDKQTIEQEIGPLPLKSEALLPTITPGVHDVAVMAYDEKGAPVGFLSETVSINSAADRH